MLKIDPDFVPEGLETKEVFGVFFEQKRNNLIPNETLLHNIVTRNQVLPESAIRDLVVAMITMKYTQSNSVCFALDGQIIGCGAGQQARLLCTRLAASKADTWYLRQHPDMLNLQFNERVGRPDRDNAMDRLLQDNLSKAETNALMKLFAEPPKKLSIAQKRKWLKGLRNVAVASDAYFPFRDNIDRAQQSGAQYIVQPGGSIRDDSVIEACDEYGMVMALSGVRMFHH